MPGLVRGLHIAIVKLKRREEGQGKPHTLVQGFLLELETIP